MTQSRMQSFIEAVVNVLVGFLTSTLANLAVLPAFGYHVSVGDAFGIGMVFTLVSVVRTYALRRAFNRHQGTHK